MDAEIPYAAHSGGSARFDKSGADHAA